MFASLVHLFTLGLFVLYYAWLNQSLLESKVLLFWHFHMEVSHHLYKESKQDLWWEYWFPFILWYKIYLSTKDKLHLFVCSFLPSDVRTCWKCLDVLNHNALRKAIWDRLYIFICVVKTLRGWELQQDWTDLPAWGKGEMPFTLALVPTPAL